MKTIILLCMTLKAFNCNSQSLPVVINTWAFLNSTQKAWGVLSNGGSALDAVENGARTCEELQCDYTVGFGGSPDENGETTLDAMIMDGKTLNVGAVADLRRVKNAIGVARFVLEHTQHSLLVGDQATAFAIQMGFNEESLSTDYSKSLWKEWKEGNCQPNFWTNVEPDSKEQCGPYQPLSANSIYFERNKFGKDNHDTIGIIAIDGDGNIATATSSNGARNKIPGRVGDSPIIGAGSYAVNGIGGAAATGDGDVMMRFLPSFLAVELMRQGSAPAEAAEAAIRRIAEKYPTFSGAVIALNATGYYSAACHGMNSFPFSVRNSNLDDVSINYVTCI